MMSVMSEIIAIHVHFQVSSKLHNNTNQAELENRLRALTESLIQKQTALEAISTEKTSLSLQLERMEVQSICRDLEIFLRIEMIDANCSVLLSFNDLLTYFYF